MSERVTKCKVLAQCAWPGLAQLWHRGAYAGLGLAVGFALLLNLALVASFGWPELLSSSARTVTWFVVLGIWLVGGVASYIPLRREAARTLRRALAAESPHDEEETLLEDADAAEDDEPDLFGDATREYLKGNWFEVERLLKEMLHREPGDVEARIMGATLCRHTGRLEEATRRLDGAARLERSERWQIEIACERRLIDRKQERLRDSTEDETAELDPPEIRAAA